MVQYARYNHVEINKNVKFDLSWDYWQVCQKLNLNWLTRFFCAFTLN